MILPSFTDKSTSTVLSYLASNYAHARMQALFGLNTLCLRDRMVPDFPCSEVQYSH